MTNLDIDVFSIQLFLISISLSQTNSIITIYQCYENRKKNDKKNSAELQLRLKGLEV